MAANLSITAAFLVAAMREEADDMAARGDFAASDSLDRLAAMLEVGLL